jgi:GT2 family glycosyltransferase
LTTKTWRSALLPANRREGNVEPAGGPKADPIASGRLYDEAYYRSGCGPVPYERNDHWLRFFAGIAEEIARSLKPRKVCDAGCAKGLLVEALWTRGIEAWGVDISSYAISQVRPDVQSYCRVASLTEPIAGHYDLITCIEVLEHMTAEEARIAIGNMTAATDTILFSSTPSDFNEPTHVNVRPVVSWLRLFTEFDFQPDVLFDASFVAPHAMLLRRQKERLPDEVLVLFSELILYKLTLGDRHRKTERLEAELDHARQENLQRKQEIQQLHNEIASLRAQGEESEFKSPETAGEMQTVAAAFSQGFERARAESQRQAVRLRSLESRLEGVSRQTQEILNSRIWRTLCAGSAILLSIPRLFAQRSPRRNRLSRPDAVSPEQSDKPSQNPASVNALQRLNKLPPSDEFHLSHCDEPTPDASGPCTGQVPVRGWAIAESGIARVEVQLQDHPPVSAKAGLLRADVGQHHPGVPEAKKSGFYSEIDTSSLPNGRYPIYIRTISRTGSVRQLETFLHVDHDAAYASDYARWIAEFEDRDDRLIGFAMRGFRLRPVVSVLLPVYQTPPAILRNAIDSVIAQSYSNWELCIADDHSQSAEVETILQSYARQDPRIKVSFRASNGGISAASNAALNLASGEFVALLDHDDELVQDALYWAVEAINRRPETDLLYSDEDKIDEAGGRYDPFFKPEWSPDLLLSENYIAHFLVCRRELMTEVGGFCSKYDGSQDYDLILRLTEKTGNILHIPRILYHWRASATSTASVADQKSYAAEAAHRALRDHLERRGIEARVVPGLIAGRWRVRYVMPTEPAVSIIIAAGGKLEALRSNLKSLLAKTDYQNYEIVVIDNSKRGEIEGLAKDFSAEFPRRVRYIDWRQKPFNYAVINNEAARQCSSPLLVFLNDDTEVIAGDWLTAMAELASRTEVGCVGAKLLYPEGRIQHAGVVMGVFENCGHAFKGLDAHRQHYFDLPDVIRNVSAVTGACLATKARLFQEVGGFDEEKFPVAFNDVDLCLKIGQKGYRVLYTPHAVLYHHEAFSKTAKDLVPHPNEVEAMRTKWKDVIEADPFYSPNLTRSAEDYSLKRKG